MKSKGRQVVDAAGFENDRRLFPPTINSLRGYPHWPDCDAEYFLKQDLDDNMDEVLELNSFTTSGQSINCFPWMFFERTFTKNDELAT